MTGARGRNGNSVATGDGGGTLGAALANYLWHAGSK